MRRIVVAAVLLAGMVGAGALPAFAMGPPQGAFSVDITLTQGSSSCSGVVTVDYSGPPAISEIDIEHIVGSPAPGGKDVLVHGTKATETLEFTTPLGSSVLITPLPDAPPRGRTAARDGRKRPCAAGAALPSECCR